MKNKLDILLFTFNLLLFNSKLSSLFDVENVSTGGWKDNSFPVYTWNNIHGTSTSTSALNNLQLHFQHFKAFGIFRDQK